MMAADRKYSSFVHHELKKNHSYRLARKSASSHSLTRTSDCSSEAVSPEELERKNCTFLLATLNGQSVQIKADKVEKRTRLKRLVLLLQSWYEKSRVHYLVPILILIGYSLLGGLIFYSIESPHEVEVLFRKHEFISRQTDAIFEIVLNIRTRVQSIQENTRDIPDDRIRALARYRPLAVNDVKLSVYWYTITIYYLTDVESHKSTALQPDQPERHLAEHFRSVQGRIEALGNYTEQLAQRCWEIVLEGNGRSEISRRKLERSLRLFDDLTGLAGAVRPTWTFWNSMFLAVTTYTTIGYGNITPKTGLGKLSVILYAIVGIPLVLMILHKLGHFFLFGLQRFWDGLILTTQLLRHGTKSEQQQQQQHRVTLMLDTAAGKESFNMPLLLAVGVTFIWMFTCAAIFLKFEKDWTYFKSFYFFFISLTTIGFGDVTPTNSKDMFIIFGLIIIGLSLVSMCINVVQIKLEYYFEELLLTMMEEYENAQLSDAGEFTPQPSIEHGLGMMQIWRMWRKRRKRERHKEREEEKSTHLVFSVAAEVRKKLTKSLPFGRRRRDVLIDQFEKLLDQCHIGTQTNIGLSGYDKAIQMPESQSSDSLTTWSRNRPSICSDQLVTSDIVRKSTKSLSHSSSCNPAATSPSIHSVQSVPSHIFYIDKSTESEFLDFTRRWTFVETGKTPRGSPRGLIHTGSMKRQRKQLFNVCLRNIIPKVDPQFDYCKTIVEGDECFYRKSRQYLRMNLLKRKSDKCIHRSFSM